MWRVVPFAALWLVSVLRVSAQTLASPADLPEITRILDTARRDRSQPCWIDRTDHAVMDFSFRYGAGFGVTCHFIGSVPDKTLFAFIRVTPKHAAPVVMIETFEMPKTPELFRGDPRIFQASMLAGFSVGEGEYRVETAITDRSQVMGYAHWHLKAKEAHGGTSFPLEQTPNTVKLPEHALWDGKLDPEGIRLTVLLDAAPVDLFGAHPQTFEYGIFSPRVSHMMPALLKMESLYDLPQSMSSLLRQVPARWVHLVAFNLDQQTEIFRQDKLTPDDLPKLADAIKKLELATVPSDALRKNSWAEWLAQLFQKELAASSPPDVVVFLGPRVHFDDRFPSQTLEAVRKARSRIYYFKLAFPTQAGRDAVEQMTQASGGKTIAIYSPETLQKAINQLREETSSGKRETPAPVTTKNPGR